MEKADAILRMQEYIEKNYMDDITMTTLSKVSLYSPWYSYRIFKEATKYTPFEYIRRLRLSKSALKLRDSSIKIIDIAYEYNYDSVDGYQRAFYREFGVNPYEYSKNPIPICLFIPYKIYKKEEKKTMSEVKSVFVSLVERPARKVIIKRGIKATHYFEYCNEVGCDVWGILTSVKSLFGEPVCLFLPDELIKENTSKYVQGVEVPLDYTGKIPEGFEIIELKACKYLMFNGEPFKEEDFEEAIQNVWTAIERYNPSNLGYKWDESNPRIQLEPIGERGYIELLAVK